MGKGFVGFGHPVGVFTFFYGAAASVVGIEKFGGQFADHAFFAARARMSAIFSATAAGGSPHVR